MNVGKYPSEVRAAIVSRHRRGGLTHVQLAALFGVSRATVGKIVREARARTIPVRLDQQEGRHA
jgi:transposase-like protein